MVSVDGDLLLAVEAEDGVLYDLSSLEPDLASVEELALASALSGVSIDDIARRILASGEADTYNLDDIIQDSRSGAGDLVLDRPFDPPEVWAAGVTYKTSEMERRRESQTPDIYSRVYTAARPELFFKATPDRCVGPFDAIGVRGDSRWNVPEPELAVVLFRGHIIGYTIGNDVSSREIEGENPLYLPQAKVYERCCAIGPCFVTADSLGDPHSLDVHCRIYREAEEVFSGQTSTSLMARSCQELADWLQRHNPVPDMTALLTGTAIVPPPDFNLQEDDTVVITIQGIGALENPVIEV